jgi:hypothetical protein
LNPLLLNKGAAFSRIFLRVCSPFNMGLTSLSDWPPIGA